MEQLNDEDQEATFNAAYALTMMDKAEPQRVIPIFVQALRIRDWNGESRYRAAKALGRLGVPARISLPALSSTSRDQSEWVRDASIEAIQMINNPNSVGASDSN